MRMEILFLEQVLDLRKERKLKGKDERRSESIQSLQDCMVHKVRMTKPIVWTKTDLERRNTEPERTQRWDQHLEARVIV